ncbi:MAG: glycerol-3-phosphate 1-O-acyltransferase PlsY [Myxococcota bacterium]|nr:glycerol-3-phosphate 1-O-acyltransferase PlsY [Myxococcota bacterium]
MPLLAILVGYLLGSIPFGVLIARWKAGIDPRSGGSGNIGATNVARVAGKKLGVLTLLLDAGKGALAVGLAVLLFPDQPRLHALVGLAAFLGHVFPPWLRFKGGKGVATALGVLLVLLPEAAGVGFGVYAAVFITLRISSIGSLLGAISAAVTAFFTDRPREYAWLCVTLLVLMLFTHRSNLSRLLRRTEKAL